MTNCVKFRILNFVVALAIGLLWNHGQQGLAIGLLALHIGQSIAWVMESRTN